MSTEASSALPARVRIGLVLAAISNSSTGIWALFFPRSWYNDFPGIGLGWVQAFGRYNEHFIQDIGGAYLAFGILFAWALFSFEPRVVQVASGGYLVFAVPHLLIHIFVRAGLSSTAYAGTVGSLVFGVGIAFWLFLEARTRLSEEQPEVPAREHP